MKRLLALLFLAALASSSRAQLNILLYDDTGVGSGFGLPYYENFKDAILNLGHNCTLATSESAFNSQLLGGTWDMVVCDVGNYPNALTTLDNVRTYLNSDRPVIYGHWQATNYASHAIFSQEGVVVSSAIGGAPPGMIADWGAGSLFTAPNTVPTITGGSSGMYGIYAQYSDSSGTAVEHGGYTVSPAANQVAITLGQSNRFIFNAFCLDPYTSVNGDGDAKPDIVELAENEIAFLLGPACGITSPLPADVVSGDVVIDYRLTDPELDPLIATFEFSTDMGVTFSPCTPAPGSVNPTAPTPTPAVGQIFTWDSVADGVAQVMVTITTIRITVFDGADQGRCQVDVEVDNVIPRPVCMVTPPAGVQVGDVDLDIVALSINSPVVDFAVEFSTDGGTTWATATASPASPQPNPAIGVSVGLHDFIWDSRTDGVGVAAPVTGVLVRLAITDGVAPVPPQDYCTSVPFDVDNTSLCGLICGDCDQNRAGPNILDALVGAQIGAGLIVPTPTQVACCDVDANTMVNVIDALQIAQDAAGIPVTLTCL